MRASRRAIVLSLFAAVGLVAAAPSLRMEDCHWKSLTEPDPLDGAESGDPSSEYLFTHWSDYDKAKDIGAFVYSIRNDHPKNLLPVEWLDGNGGYVLQFRRLAPLGCGTNTLKSRLSWVQDSKSVIKYGPTTQTTKAVRIYAEDGTVEHPKQTVEGELTSTLSADLLDGENRPHPLRLELVSRSSGTSVSYVIANNGSKDQVFAIPVLSTAWRARIPGADVKTRWPARETGAEVEEFVIQSKKSLTFEVVVPSSVALVPRTVQFQIRDTDGVGIVSGRVAVHMPVLMQ